MMEKIISDMIQRFGHFEHDTNLEDIYDYRLWRVTCPCGRRAVQ